MSEEKATYQCSLSAQELRIGNWVYDGERTQVPLKELGITPFVLPYRDFNNEREPSQYEKDLARWANKQWLFKSCDFADFSPRKGFRCKEYFTDLIREL